MMKQNIQIYLADAAPCTCVVLFHGISVTEIFKFWRNLVIPIGMAEYCVKGGRIPPKSEWLAAMQMMVGRGTRRVRNSGGGSFQRCGAGLDMVWLENLSSDRGRLRLMNRLAGWQRVHEDI